MNKPLTVNNMNPKKPIQAVTLSLHACKRARERYQWRPETLERMAEKALLSGLVRNNTKGSLKKYFDVKEENHAGKIKLCLYGETVFVFSNQKKLVTVWTLPLQYRALAKVFRQKLQKEQFLMMILPLPAF